MSTVLDRMPSLPDWGIEPVPEEQRTLSGFDLTVLWGDLGIGVLVLVTGALLVPGLGFPVAMAAIIVGSVIGVGLLALAGLAGAEYGIPTMVLFRPVLGVRGSWLPSLLNALQLLGWTAVELWAMSFVADLVTQKVFGFSARWLWLAIAAVLCAGLALWGPLGVTRVWLERFGVWVVVAISLAITVLVLTSGHLSTLGAGGKGGFPTFGPALDLVIAMPVSWLPLVADYTRFAREGRAAFIGTGTGYLIANIWLYALGAALVLTEGASPSPAGIASGILAVAGGSMAGLIFLAGLLVGETDEAFADIYSGAVSLKNIFPRLSQGALTLSISALGTVLAAWLTMDRFESFLFLLGSIFVPLFGILIADHFVIRRRAIVVEELYGTSGPYWFDGGIKASAFIPWAAGFFVYHWVVPTGPVWWVDAAKAVLGTPLAVRWPWMAASIPSFAVASLLTLLVARISSRRGGVNEGVL